ncbi:MAG: glycosyltransferase [Candidatus Thorarchaeota archaeon]
MVEYSLILPCYKRLDRTYSTIETLKLHTHENFEVIGIDDCSKDGTAEFLDGALGWIPHKVIVHEERKGFTASVNEGLAQASGDYLVILNNDLLFTPDWLPHLRDCLENSPKKLKLDKVGIVGAVSNFSAGLQRVPGVKIAPGQATQFARDFYRLNRKKWIPTHFLAFFCVLLSRELYEKIGGLDERFNPGGYDDYDYVLRAIEAGYSAVVCGDTFVYHFGQQSTSLPELRWMKGGLHNRWKFYEKWESKGPLNVIGLCRVKNGMPYFEKMLRSMERVCDGIVIFDDHSTDDTVKVAKKSKKVLEVIPSPFDDFNDARDREYLLQRALTYKPTHLFFLDADEEVEPSFTRKEMERLCRSILPQIKTWRFKQLTFWRGTTMIRRDDVWGAQTFPRLLKVFPGLHITSDHPLGLHSSYPITPLDTHRVCPFRIKHYGFADYEVAKKKYHFFETKDKAKDPIRIGHKSYRHLVDESDLKLVPFHEKNDVTLMTIVRNEGEWIDEFMEMVYGVFNEIILVDTGSKDDTIEKAKRWGAKVYSFPWNGSFADARNFGLGKVRTRWVCHLDPDERFGDFEYLLQLVEGEKDGYIFSVRNFHKGGQVSLTQSIRLFKLQPLKEVGDNRRLYYEGFVHETVEHSLSKLPEVRLGWSKVPIDHYGYLKPDAIIDEKLKNYEKLNEMQIQKNPKDPRPYFNLALHYINLGLEEKAEQYLRKSIELNPDFPLARKELGYLLARWSQQEFKEAEKRLPPGHPLKGAMKKAIAGLDEVVEYPIYVGSQRLKHA